MPGGGQGLAEALPRLRARAWPKGWKSPPQSERLAKYRRMILELLFTERNHVCSVCVSNGHCELQALARSWASTHVHFLTDIRSDRWMRRTIVSCMDHNRCILCTRCVRVCDEIEGAHTWDVMGRGIDANVITDLNQPWGSVRDLHRLRQVRPCLPDGGAVRKKGARSRKWKSAESSCPT